MTKLLLQKNVLILCASVLLWVSGASFADAQACGNLPNGCPQGQVCVRQSFGVEFCSADPAFQGCTGANPSNATRICTCNASGNIYTWSCTARNITPDQCPQPQPNVGRACSCVFSGGNYVWDCGSSGPISNPTASTPSAPPAFVPLANVSGSKLGNLYGSASGNLATYIERLFGFALSLGAILAILRIAWGGYLYMTTDLWSSKERAREVLRETVLGLFLLLAVWIILSQINPDILRLNVLETLRQNSIP